MMVEGDAKSVIKDPDDGREPSGLLSFWSMPIVRYSKEHNSSETGFVSVLN
jgi:hypothetical protein